MLINGLNYHVEIAGKGSPLLLLHGFTGSTNNWKPHISVFAQHFTVITIDLPGHGKTDSPPDLARYAMQPVTDDLATIIRILDLEPVHLLGYSMGGRLALYFALHNQQFLHSLILESSSPGLVTEAERTERQNRDNALAERIEHDGIESFVDFWGNISLFESQKCLPENIRLNLRSQRLNNLPHGLANSLRGMGTGIQPSLWSQLDQLELPVLLLAGELDEKFVGISNLMASKIPHVKRWVVPDAGHTVHLEKPEIFQQTVLEFLR